MVSAAFVVVTAAVVVVLPVVAVVVAVVVGVAPTPGMLDSREPVLYLSYKAAAAPTNAAL